MRESEAIVEQAREVLRVEADGILGLVSQLGQNFSTMVEKICKSKGRVVIGGIGKSGLIGQKIAATLNSTGTRALFLHPVEAMHGDLGVVGKHDIFLALSNSGETEELNMLVPSVKAIGCPVIAFTGKPTSTLAKQSDLVINVAVKKEACPLGLAPTTSTTALLAIGDALAVCLINKKGFKSSDFKKFHPAGALGQRLSLSVADLMLTDENVPSVTTETPMKQALAVVDHLEMGFTLVVDADNTLVGIITDGDIRRTIYRKENIYDLKVEDIMTPNPFRVLPDSPVYDALNTMEQYQITVLPVADSDGQVLGILHLHDILGKGAFKFNGKTDQETA